MAGLPLPKSPPGCCWSWGCIIRWLRPLDGRASPNGRWRWNCWRHCPPRHCCWPIGSAGCAAFLAPAQAMCAVVGSHFLIRARSKYQGANPPAFEGWQPVGAPCRCAQKGNQRIIVQWMEVREIRARVQRPGFRPVHAAFVDQLARSRDRTRPSNWSNCMRNAGNTSCITGNSNASCAKPTSCKATPRKPAPRKSPPSSRASAPVGHSTSRRGRGANTSAARELY